MKNPIRANDLKVAFAIASSYGISALSLKDAVYDVLAAMRGVPEGKRHAAGHKAARKFLAGDLHVPVKSIPESPGRAQAIGQWESARRRCRQRTEMFSFDLHSKWFAVENGVCPRCGAVGTFADDRGVCGCGFNYGVPQTGDEEHGDALEKLLGNARQSA